jgi:hypothetical protein
MDCFSFKDHLNRIILPSNYHNHWTLLTYFWTSWGNLSRTNICHCRPDDSSVVAGGYWAHFSHKIFRLFHAPLQTWESPNHHTPLLPTFWTDWKIRQGLGTGRTEYCLYYYRILWQTAWPYLETVLGRHQNLQVRQNSSLSPRKGWLWVDSYP